MAQKEDILEQIVEEYLIHKGYFVQRNIKYRPEQSDPDYIAKKDSVRSDIDVLAFHPRKAGAERVLAFNIKSYQSGFDFRSVIAQIEAQGEINGRSAHLSYREFCIPKWSRAFVKAIQERTGETKFTHVLAVTFPKNDPMLWTTNARFRKSLPGVRLEVMHLREMIEEIEPTLTTTPAATDIGRTLQLFRAAGLRPKPAKREVSEVSVED